MPYIKLADRPRAWITPEGSGPLCYALCKQINDYRLRHGDSFATFAEIIAAIDVADSEFRRCVLEPYEQRKREENGDVW